ncbi:hypothetical protein BOTCAL_0184g00120 [Botryotinia calthae]|uniref:Uncharacterized protein n=1 Tax=Botryotinia calthae TaxID=38488 RepID=A0A4Y8D2I0_9HELO|nr:hypothetical protein BOTCAL_0184g00120 [Botryotinia calthae]
MVFDKKLYPFGPALPHSTGIVDRVRIIDEHFTPYKIKLWVVVRITFHKRVWIVPTSPRPFARPPARSEPSAPAKNY